MEGDCEEGTFNLDIDAIKKLVGRITKILGGKAGPIAAIGIIVGGEVFGGLGMKGKVEMAYDCCSKIKTCWRGTVISILDSRTKCWYWDWGKGSTASKWIDVQLPIQQSDMTDDTYGGMITNSLTQLNFDLESAFVQFDSEATTFCTKRKNSVIGIPDETTESN